MNRCISRWGVESQGRKWPLRVERAYAVETVVVVETTDHEQSLGRSARNLTRHTTI